MYSMYPIFNSKYISCFNITSDLNFILEKDKGEVLFIVGWQNNWAASKEKFKIILKLREKYRKIAFFEDNDSSESELLEILPIVDLLYKKTLYVNKSNYQKVFSDNRIFAEYYKDKYNLEPTANKIPYPRLKNLGDLKKLRIAWNIGFGTYPLSENRNKISNLIYKFFGSYGLWLIPQKDYFKKKMPQPDNNKCQARFGYKGYGNLVGFQRKILLDQVIGNSNFLTGQIPLKNYNKEITNVKAILSPFGWGEVCFRDFEAIFNGAVLVKPDMGHIETYPNIFKNNQTYLPINWDGTDLNEKVEFLLSNTSFADELRNNAWNQLKEDYQKIDDKVKEIINELLS